MAQANRRATPAVNPVSAAVLVGLAIVGCFVGCFVGCCRTGANHTCDFTPPGPPAMDGGTDGPLLCGSQVCEDGKVCCVTKVPLNATCIEPAMFQSLHCEKIALPCVKPSDCPGGMACCVRFNPDGTGLVSCQPQALCIAGENTAIACASAADCPSVWPACATISEPPQPDFKICR